MPHDVYAGRSSTMKVTSPEDDVERRKEGGANDHQHAEGDGDVGEDRRLGRIDEGGEHGVEHGEAASGVMTSCWCNVDVSRGRHGRVQAYGRGLRVCGASDGVLVQLSFEADTLHPGDHLELGRELGDRGGGLGGIALAAPERESEHAKVREQRDDGGKVLQKKRNPESETKRM